MPDLGYSESVPAQKNASGPVPSYVKSLTSREDWLRAYTEPDTSWKKPSKSPSFTPLRSVPAILIKVVICVSRFKFKFFSYGST